MDIPPQYDLPEADKSCGATPVETTARKVSLGTARRHFRFASTGGVNKDAKFTKIKDELATPVRSPGPTPGESSHGGPLSGIQRGTAGQASLDKKSHRFAKRT